MASTIQETKTTSPVPTDAEIDLSKYLKTLLQQIAEREGFVNYTNTVRPGSNAGDGFSSSMLSVILSGVRQNKADEQLALVCKIPPPDGLRREMIIKPFQREILMYETILPQLVKFQREKGVTNDDAFLAFPKCYGTYSCADTMEYAIVLEDLRDSGYRLWSKFQSIDYNHVRMAVTELGKFHAISFALREQKPEIFETFTKVDSVILDGWAKCPSFVGLLKKSYDISLNMLSEGDLEERKMMRCHGDFWNNNMMFEYASADSMVPIRVRLIDWQMSSFSTPATDLLYYLYTTTEKPLRKVHFDDILRTYHDNMATLLGQLGGDGTGQFPFDAFQNQLRKGGMYAMVMAPLVLQAVTTKAEDLPDLNNMSADCGDGFDFTKNCIAAGYEERVREVIRDYVGRGYFVK